MQSSVDAPMHALSRFPSLPLAALSFANFALGTTSLIVLGLSTPMTAEFGATSGAAGSLVAVFALTYAIAAPVMQWALSGRLRHRSMMLVGLGLLTAGSLWGALAGSFGELLASRVAAALGGAMLGPTSAAAGAALVSPEQRSRALSAVFAGFTLSSVAGVPLAAWLGFSFGWRGATACVGVMALAAAAAVAATLPDRGEIETPLSLKAVGLMLTDRRVAGGLGTTGLHLAAQFAVYALMSPLLIVHFGLDSSVMPIALLLFGIGGVAGNALAGRLADRVGPGPIVIVSLLGLGATAAVLCLPLPGWAAAVVLAACACFGTLFTAPQQSRLSAVVPPGARGAVLALNASASYLGLALGSAVAGLTQAVLGFAALGGTSLLLLILASGSFFFSTRQQQKL